MSRKYSRRKTTDNGGPDPGHQYTILTVHTNGYGRTLTWTGRHRKDCVRCVSTRETPKTFSLVSGKPLPEKITDQEMFDWMIQAGHAVYLTSCYLKSAFEASDRGDNEQAQELLIRCGRTIAGIPISPDGGATAELLCKAGDSLHDAAYALANGDGEEASLLIDQSRAQINRYTQSLPTKKESHA